MHSSVNVSVHVNEQKITFDTNQILGSMLKERAGIPVEEELMQSVLHGADILIANTASYSIDSSMKFYSASYHKPITIVIDNKEYELASPDITGMALRDIAGITADGTKLLRDGKGEADLLIQDAVSYSLRNKDEFFIVPPGIDNGGRNDKFTS